MAATWEKIAYVLDTFQKELTLLAKTTDYTVTTSDFEKCLSMNSTGIASFTLSNIDASYVGRRIRFYNLSNYKVKIIPYSGGNIDGEDGISTSIIYSFIELTVVGANSWHVSSVGNLFSELDSFGTWGVAIVPYAGYSHVREITISSAYVSGSSNFTDYIFTFNSTENFLRTIGNGGDVTDDDGYDIIFTDTSNTKLDHEIEIYTNTSGKFVAHVRIPTVYYNQDTVIRIHYGNSSISSSQENVSGVWDSNYQAVYHMTEIDAVDSKGSHNGTGYGGVNVVTGQVGDGVEFDSSNDYISLGTWDPSTSALTIEAVVDWNGYDGTYQTILAKRDDWGTTNMRWQLYHDYNNTAISWANGSSIITFGTTQDFVSGLNHIVLRHTSGGIPNIILNGTQYAGSGSISWGSDTASLLRIGMTNSIGESWDGIIDEMRISNNIRDLDRMVTNNAMFTNPSIFYSIGDEL